MSEISQTQTCDAGGGSRQQHHKRNLTLPNDVEHWSFTTPREKPVKIVCLGGRPLTQHTGGEVDSRGLAEPYMDGVVICMAGHRVSLAPEGMIRVCE
jgi:hypothetical protein